MKNKSRSGILEEDLCRPVSDYLTSLGYSVRSEVKHWDITAIKGDELIAVELKRSINISLLIQATQRQRAADSVYVAVPRPKFSIYRGKRWRHLCHLLRRLELGLIVVSFRHGAAADVEIVFHPKSFRRRKSRKNRSMILEEINGRSADYNTAGSSGKKLMTAYKEKALYIACCLAERGSLSTRQLRGLETGPKTASILYKNFYGWFDRVARGQYTLNDKGFKILESYPELTARFRRKAREADINNQVE